MALIGQRTAIMSLGMSCQTARQIQDHHALLQELTGEELENVPTPFDWIICGPGDVGRMLLDGRTWPAGVGELEQRHKPYWPDRRCWFWHAPGAVVDFPTFDAKAAERFANLERVRAARRRVFFLSNIQGNLHAHRRDHGGFDIAFTRPDLEILAQGVQAALGGGPIHMVTHEGQAPRADGVTRWSVPRDGAGWSGKATTWGPVIRGAFGQKKAPARGRGKVGRSVWAGTGA